jgi:hypothetical protein
LFDYTYYVAKIQATGDGILGVYLLRFVGASVYLTAGCLRVGRYEALLKESSGRIQLVQSDVKAHGEYVGTGELATFRS